MIQCLLVTGDKPARDTIRMGLEQTQAFEVEHAEDRWALQLAESRPFDVVISDTALGDGSDGLEFLREMRHILPNADFILITRSRNQTRYLTREKEELNISAFITMPVFVLDFFLTIKRVIERSAAYAGTP